MSVVDEHSHAEDPIRPSIPPLLAVGLGLWAACAAMFAVGRVQDMAVCVMEGVAFCAAACGAMAFLWRFRGALIWCVLTGALAGAACGCAGAAALHTAQHDVATQPAATLRFEALEDATPGLYGSQGTARARLPDGRAVDVRLSFEKDSYAPRYGEVFEAAVSLAPPSEKSADYCWRTSVAAEARARDVRPLERTDALGALTSLRSRALDVLAAQGGEGAAVLQALVCGSRAALNETDIYQAFKVVGLAHLVAVSGAHLVIVCSLAAAVLRALRAPRVFSIAAQVAFILCFLALSAAPVSAVRAALMTLCGLGSFFARRRSASASALGACMVGAVVLNPATALSVSFALSALSTLGIVLFAPLVSAWIRRCVPRLPRFATDALALTVASSVVAQPLAVALFSQLSLISLLSNVVTAPLFAPVCGLGLAAALAGALVPGAAPFLLVPAEGGAEALCALVRLVAEVPYASIPVNLPLGAAFALTVVGMVALWIAWPQARVRATVALAGVLVAVFALLVIIIPRTAGNEIVMLDVGQGDAFLIRSGSAAVLVDTGNKDNLLREALARHGVLHLDALVITHGDDDHCGSLESLKGVVQVDNVLLARDALSCGCAACASLRTSAQALVGESNVEGLTAGDRIRVGVFDLDVVWPEHFQDEGGNADSVCLLARADVNADGVTDWTTLFTGDAEHDQLQEMVDKSVVGPIDVLKVGHHGSKNALTPALAQALTPRLALVSAGAGNRYGHPAPATLEVLEATGTQVLRTDEEGDVSCILEPDGIRVETLR